MAGIHVVRGRHWTQDEEVKYGRIGTISSLVKKGKGLEVVIKWSNDENSCLHYPSKDDIAVLDSSVLGITHSRTKCSDCKKKAIDGFLWICADCRGVKLCSDCYHEDKHKLKHTFERVDKCGNSGIRIGKRQNLGKTNLTGLRRYDGKSHYIDHLPSLWDWKELHELEQKTFTENDTVYGAVTLDDEISTTETMDASNKFTAERDSNPYMNDQQLGDNIYANEQDNQNANPYTNDELCYQPLSLSEDVPSELYDDIIHDSKKIITTKEQDDVNKPYANDNTNNEEIYDDVDVQDNSKPTPPDNDCNSIYENQDNAPLDEPDVHENPDNREKTKAPRAKSILSSLLTKTRKNSPSTGDAKDIKKGKRKSKTSGSYSLVGLPDDTEESKVFDTNDDSIYDTFEGPEEAYMEPLATRKNKPNNNDSSAQTLNVVIGFSYVPRGGKTDELTLSPGDVVMDVSASEEGWLRGTLAGKTGLFPESVIKERILVDKTNSTSEIMSRRKLPPTPAASTPKEMAATDSAAPRRDVTSPLPPIPGVSKSNASLELNMSKEKKSDISDNSHPAENSVAANSENSTKTAEQQKKPDGQRVLIIKAATPSDNSKPVVSPLKSEPGPIIQKQVSEKPTPPKFKRNDKVCFSKTTDEIQGLNLWKDEIKEVIKKVGVITDIHASGDVLVKFDSICTRLSPVILKNANEETLRPTRRMSQMLQNRVSMMVNREAQ